MLKKIFCIFTAIVLVTLSLAGCSGNQQVAKESKNKDNLKSLLVFSGAGLRKPMDEIGKVFEDKYGVKVEYSYAGSAQILSQIEVSGKGDVYVPGSMYYYHAAKEKGLVEEKKDVAYHIPVIGVPKGNPAGVESLKDLSKDNVKVVLGDEKACAIGKVAKKLLEANGIKEAVDKNVIAKAPTVNELVVYLSIKQADASIIWEDNVVGVKDVEIVYIPKEKNIIKTIPVCVVKNSKQKDLARKFVDFVASKEGKEIFQKYGFKIVE